MARQNDLRVSPAQEEEAEAAGQQVRAPLKAPSKTNYKNRADTGENCEVFRGSEDDNARNDRTTGAAGRQDELDSDDAADLAGLINDASLSGANNPGIKPSTKPSEGTLSRTINFINGIFAGSSQKSAESPGGNKGMTRQYSAPQTWGRQPQDPSQAISGNSAVLSGDKTILGKSPARPNATFQDISKPQKLRRSGRPNPYEVPQSPPRSPALEPEPTASKRRGPKPKRANAQEKPEQLMAAADEPLASAEEELAEFQGHFEHPEKAPGRARRATSVTEQRNTRSKRTTGSTRTTGPDDLEEFQRHHGRGQRKSMGESGDPLQFSSPTQSWASISKTQLGDRDAGDQARLSAAHLVDLQDNLEILSRTKTHSKYKGPVSGVTDIQPGGKVQITPAKRASDIEKDSVQNNAQIEVNGISPILSSLTPAKSNQDSLRRLKRPSQRVVKAARDHKSSTVTQRVTNERPFRGTASAQISEGAQDEASDEEVNNQPESGVYRAPTPGATTSNEDSATAFITEEIVEDLKKTIDKAGTKDGERVVKVDDMWTSIAKTLTRSVNRLISKYKAMKVLRSADVVDVGKIDKEHETAVQILAIICQKAQVVLTTRLGKQKLAGRFEEGKYRTNMLQDLYLSVIPGLVEALHQAVLSQQDQKALGISDLEELYAILKILYDLVKASIAEDKTVQPRAPRTNSFSISKPTRTIWPILRALYPECGKKLAARKHAAKAEQVRKALPDRARKRKERLEAEQRQEAEEFQQRLRERNTAIIASLNERREQLGLPPCSQPIDMPSTSQLARTPNYKAKEPFDDVDHKEDGRLTGVFGSRNSHPGTAPKEWTVVEMETLVEGLRGDRGPTRYEKLATKLERTLDEIFERAKYLKMQMEYTLKRLQEENPDKQFPQIKPWIENIGAEGFLNQ